MARNIRSAIDRKQRKDPVLRKTKRAYVAMALVYLIVIAFNMVVENLVYLGSRSQYDKNISSVNTIDAIQNEFAQINQDVLLYVAGEKEHNGINILNSIENEFIEIENLKDVYLKDIADSDLLRRRFIHATYALDAYKRKIDEVQDNLADMENESVVSIYTQELEPLQVTANEMLEAVVEISTADCKKAEQQTTLNHIIAQASLIVVSIILFIALWILGNRQIKTLIEVQQQTRELNEASARLTKSRKKLLDSAMTNILTGMKNRYALDESLSQLINNTQFNIAVFDIDNFRAFNDTYGYELGDEYLSTIAERLKEEYSDYAEMFNITGNEFCMIFYEHVSDAQAQQLAEQIRQGIGQPTMMTGNIVLQATVSASIYHYLPSDNLDVNTLLMKLDSALHTAKRDGGNRIYQIQ
ncbi:MAG: GGDEF domain-containing protein [Ruminococcus sp.]|nr:GGDEF domain-containing protein [Ruminococcus sp.]